MNNDVIHLRKFKQRDNTVHTGNVRFVFIKSFRIVHRRFPLKTSMKPSCLDHVVTTMSVMMRGRMLAQTKYKHDINMVPISYQLGLNIVPCCYHVGHYRAIWPIWYHVDTFLLLTNVIVLRTYLGFWWYKEKFPWVSLEKFKQNWPLLGVFEG